MANLATRRGLYFEEYSVGDTAISSGRTITEADVVAFAALSGDWNAIHVDAEYAASGTFGERVAHGLLGLSVATGLATRLGFMDDTVLAFRSLDWKFSGPIKISDTIHLKAMVAETKALPRLGGGSVVFDVEIINQRGEVAQRGTWTVLVKSKPTA